MNATLLVSTPAFWRAERISRPEAPISTRPSATSLEPGASATTPSVAPAGRVDGTGPLCRLTKLHRAQSAPIAIAAPVARQKAEAEAAVKRAQASGLWRNPVITEIVPGKKFWAAEEYHQDYLKKNPGGYTCHYVRR